MTTDETAEAILVAHQRRDYGSCLCGWSELGKSHARHQVAMLSEASALAAGAVVELAGALADCVVKATPYGVQDGDFVATYILPTGPLHRAMPLLERLGVIVRPGFDGRTTTP